MSIIAIQFYFLVIFSYLTNCFLYFYHIRFPALGKRILRIFPRKRTSGNLIWIPYVLLRYCSRLCSAGIFVRIKHETPELYGAKLRFCSFRALRNVLLFAARRIFPTDRLYLILPFLKFFFPRFTTIPSPESCALVIRPYCLSRPHRQQPRRPALRFFAPRNVKEPGRTSAGW